MYPSTVRVNNRYRGPVESIKRSMTELGIQADLAAIMAELDRQEAALASLREQFRYDSPFDTPQAIHRGDSVFVVDGLMGVSQATQVMAAVAQELPLKGGTLHG